VDVVDDAVGVAVDAVTTTTMMMMTMTTFGTAVQSTKYGVEYILTRTTAYCLPVLVIIILLSNDTRLK
jgi:hypothetical protein